MQSGWAVLTAAWCAPTVHGPRPSWKEIAAFASSALSLPCTVHRATLLSLCLSLSPLFMSRCMTSVMGPPPVPPLLLTCVCRAPGPDGD